VWFSGLQSLHSEEAFSYDNPNGGAVLSRCQPDATRWRDSPRSQRLWESQRICRRGDGDVDVIGMINAEYAMGPRASVRYGCSARRRREKTDHKSVWGSIYTDADDNGSITEEPM
jgi:hypothetical protein